MSCSRGPRHRRECVDHVWSNNIAVQTEENLSGDSAPSETDCLQPIPPDAFLANCEISDKGDWKTRDHMVLSTPEGSKEEEIENGT
jgi:hypothetical protein